MRQELEGEMTYEEWAATKEFSSVSPEAYWAEQAWNSSRDEFIHKIFEFINSEKYPEITKVKP